MCVVRGLLTAILCAAVPFFVVHSLSQEPLRALASVIGALGAALAVYLTLANQPLANQQAEETDKICAAITTEIAQLARFPLEQLATCQAIYEGHLVGIPRADLPTMMQTPAPTLYLAAAERVSRVHRLTLVIAFYIGLAETERCADVIAKAQRSTFFLTPIDVHSLGSILIGQCFLARQILSEAPLPAGKEGALMAKMLGQTVRMLDEQLRRSRLIFPTTEQFQ